MSREIGHNAESTESDTVRARKSHARAGTPGYGRPMHTTHALLAVALTPARGSLHSIRLRAGRRALACAA
jgi:hypothetical protein